MLLLAIVALSRGTPTALAFEPTFAQTEMATTFREALNEKRHAVAFDTLERLVASLRGHATPGDIAEFERLLIAVCLDGLQEDMGDDAFQDAWLDRASRVPPPVDPAADNWVAYGIVKLFLAQGRLLQGRKAEARVALADAGHHIRTATGPGIEAARESFDPMLQIVGDAIDDRLSAGDYVTNTGFLQRFIGKIERVYDAGYDMRVTYASADSGRAVGQVERVAMSEVKPLATISMDALLHGWR